MAWDDVTYGEFGFNADRGDIGTLEDVTYSPTTHYYSLGSGTVDANIIQVNGYSVTGTGTLGDPWGPGGSNSGGTDVNVVSVNGIPVDGIGTAGDPWGP